MSGREQRNYSRVVVSPYYMVRIYIGCRGASLTFDVGVMFSSQWVWMWCRPLQGFSVVSGVLSYAGLVTTIRLSFPPWSENVHTVQLFSAFEHHFIWGWLQLVTVTVCTNPFGSKGFSLSRSGHNLRLGFTKFDLPFTLSAANFPVKQQSVAP